MNYDENSIHLWRLPDGKHINTIDISKFYHYSKGQQRPIIRISPDSQILLLKDGEQNDRDIFFWSIPDGKFLETHSRVNGKFYILDYDESINPKSLSILVNSPVPKSPISTLCGEILTIRSLSLNGGSIGLSFEVGIQMWRLPNQSLIQISSITWRYVRGKLSKDCTILAMLAPDVGRLNPEFISCRNFDFHENEIYLWRLPDGNYLKTLRGHDSRILAIALNNNILASSSDSNICLWSLPDGSYLKTLSGHINNVHTLEISPDGKILVSVDDQYETRLWSLPKGNHLKTLSPQKGRRYNMIPNFWWEHTTPNQSNPITQDTNFLVLNDSILNKLEGVIRVWNLPNDNANTPIHKFTQQDVAEIQLRTKDSNLENGIRNALRFTLTLIQLRQQFDIDIEDSSNDISFSEFDIEID